MSCKKFVIECQESLQRLINSVGSKPEENRELEQLLQDLLQLCTDNLWPYYELLNKAIHFARDNKFISATFCYRVFLQEYKFSSLRISDIYLKCVFLADNANKIRFGYEVIFKSITELIEDEFISAELFSKFQISGYTDKKYNLYRISHKLNFGDYAGRSVQELLEKNSGYLLWSIINLDNFVLDNRIMADKRLLQHNLYAQAVGINLIKNNFVGMWESDLEDESNDESERSRNYNWERETFDALTDGQMGDWDDYEGDTDDARNAMGLD